MIKVEAITTREHLDQQKGMGWEGLGYYNLTSVSSKRLTIRLRSMASAELGIGC